MSKGSGSLEVIPLAVTSAHLRVHTKLRDLFLLRWNTQHCCVLCLLTDPKWKWHWFPSVWWSSHVYTQCLQAIRDNDLPTKVWWCEQNRVVRLTDYSILNRAYLFRWFYFVARIHEWSTPSFVSSNQFRFVFCHYIYNTFVERTENLPKWDFLQIQF